MPYSMVLDMPSHPEIESLLGEGAENVSGADTIKGLGLLHAAAADASFEMAYTNKVQLESSRPYLGMMDSKACSWRRLFSRPSLLSPELRCY